MTKYWWRTGAILALVCSSWVIHADEGDTYSSVQELEKARKARMLANQNIWWERLIPGRLEEKRRLAEEAKAQQQAAKRKPEEDKAKARQDANLRQAELNKALRREAVCQRLREIAEETGDPQLAKQADMLESRAWALYEQKISTTSARRFQPMDERELESRFTRNERTSTSESASAETGIRSIRGEKKE
ncbi:MAG TPA: hypothetical protein PKA06_02985 [Gemmatales bacterium]|nr:hypothetical protein [Gemmatales bacterium]HMP16091.1 hypothetical protein [Gemmatales bacterium]